MFYIWNHSGGLRGVGGSGGDSNLRTELCAENATCALATGFTSRTELVGFGTSRANPQRRMTGQAGDTLAQALVTGLALLEVIPDWSFKKKKEKIIFDNI